MKNLVKNPLERKQRGAAVMMLCMVFLFCGCSSLSLKDEIENEADEKLPYRQIYKVDEELPEWLNVWIEKLEIVGYSGVPSPAQIYRGIWNGRVAYYIFQPYSSCLGCTIFNENGERIVLDVDDMNNFFTIVRDWEVIYQIGPDEFGLVQKSGFNEDAR